MNRSSFKRASFTATLGLVASIGLGAGANAVGTSLGKCYDSVISTCNKSHDSFTTECALAGMDACDKQFPQLSASPVSPGDIAAMRSRVLGEVAPRAMPGAARSLQRATPARMPQRIQ